MTDDLADWYFQGPYAAMVSFASLAPSGYEWVWDAKIYVRDGDFDAPLREVLAAEGCEDGSDMVIFACGNCADRQEARDRALAAIAADVRGETAESGPLPPCPPGMLPPRST
jgi:hypothetical protein